MSEQTDQAILLSLQEMANSMAGMAQVNKELLKANQDQAKSLEDIDKLGGKSNKGIWSAADNIPVVGKTMRAVGKEIVQTIKGSFELQKKALSRGQNLDKVMKQNATTTAYLSDSMTGYTNALQTGYSMYEAGYRSNNKELARLALQTKLTGQNEKKVLATMAKNTAGMGLTQEGMSSLANTTLSVGQKYGMSTEELVDAVDSLAGQMAVFGALGLGGEMMEAATKISGSLGPAMANVGPELIAAFTSGDAMVQRSIMGISDEVAAAFSSEGTAAANKMIDATFEFAKESNRLVNQYTAGAADQTFALKNATDIYGKQIVDGNRVYKQWKEAADKQGISVAEYVNNIKKSQKVSEEFQATWDNFMSKVWSPIQQAFTNVANVFLQAITKFGPILVPLTQAILALIIAIGALKIAMVASAAAAKGAGALKEGLLNPLGKMFDARMAGGGRWKGGKQLAENRQHMMTTAPGMKDWKKMPGVWGQKIKDSFKEGAAGKAKDTVASKVSEKASAGASGMAGGGGGGIGGFLKGLGKGLKAIGSPAAMKGAATIAILAASMGIAAVGLQQFGDVSWDSIGKGLVVLTALSIAAILIGKVTGHILTGAVAIIALGVSLIPLAFAFKLIENVGIGTMFGFAGALVVLALAAAGAAFIAPFIIAGAIAFGALGLALVPLAFAMDLAVPGLFMLNEILATLATVPIGNLFLIGPALVGMAAGFVALSAGGLIGSVLDGLGKLFGGESPVEKLVKMGKAAKHINKLEKSLKNLPKQIKKMNKELKKISLKPFYIMARGIYILKKALGSLGFFDMMKLGLLGKAAGGDGAGAKATKPGGDQKMKKIDLSKLTITELNQAWRDSFKAMFDAKREAGDIQYEGRFHQGEFTGTAEGNIEAALHAEKKETAWREVNAERARRTEGTLDDRTTARSLKDNQRQIELLEAILEAQEGGNDQRAEGNQTRQDLVRGTKQRPTGMGVGADLD